MTNLSRIKVVILGTNGVGKSECSTSTEAISWASRCNRIEQFGDNRVIQVTCNCTTESCSNFLHHSLIGCKNRTYPERYYTLYNRYMPPSAVECTMGCYVCTIPRLDFENCTIAQNREYFICSCKHDRQDYFLACIENGILVDRYTESQDLKCQSVTVRYLTKRYIGEYSSGKDMTYQHKVTFDSVITEIEILDTSMCSSCLAEHLKWGDAFVVVYSVEDKASFQGAHRTLQNLAQAKESSFFSLLLLGNKRDLDYMRRVGVDDGQELSLKFGCQFYEVSAAENSAGVSLAFMSLLREARSAQLLRNLPIRRKLGVNSVSKVLALVGNLQQIFHISFYQNTQVLGTIFGKNSQSNSNGQSKKDRKKKRPSLSI